MRILFDQATPVPIRAYLEGHAVRTAAQEGWDKLRNGDLLTAAEGAGFEVLLTTDKNMRYQQNLTGRQIAIVVLGQQQWPKLSPFVQRVIQAINAAVPGSYTEVDFPPTAALERLGSERTHLPSVRARITMLPTLEHPRWPNRAQYMAHIVTGDPFRRHAEVGAGNEITERYLGVWIADAPDELTPGQSSEVTLLLMYWPDEEYADVVIGATFTLREGPKIVGFGQVISTKHPGSGFAASRRQQ